MMGERMRRKKKNRREIRLTVKLSEAEKALIERLADKLDLTMSEVVRLAVLSLLHVKLKDLQDEIKDELKQSYEHLPMMFLTL